VILALPVLSLFTTSAAVPCADLQFGRLYFVDAQPGGNGASEWMFRNVDALLQTALRIAKSMQRDALYAQSATNDVAWLELITPAPVRSTAAQPVVQPTVIADVAEVDYTPVDEDVPPTYPLVIPGVIPAEPTDVTLPQSVVPPPSAGSAVDRRMAQSRARRERPLIPEVPTPVVPRPNVPSRVMPPTAKPTQTPATTQPKPTPRDTTPREMAAPQPSASKSQPSRTPASRAPREIPSASRDTNSARDTTAERSPREPASSDGGVPNVNRIMANLRKQIQQKLPATGTSVPPRPASSRSQDEVHRFTPGQRIFCLPYGDGEIVESFFVDGREYIRVDFPNYGELKIDPSLSLVKVLSDADDARSDD
jgi:hypothetical protein